MDENKTLQKQSGRLIWMGVEAETDEVNSGRIQVSEMFWSFTAGCLIHCTGIGHTISEALAVMMEEYHQRR